jgi:processive 1,2-diacylglycerol beta-glucosyltransferase
VTPPYGGNPVGARRDRFDLISRRLRPLGFVALSERGARPVPVLPPRFATVVTFHDHLAERLVAVELPPGPGVQSGGAYRADRPLLAARHPLGTRRLRELVEEQVASGAGDVRSGRLQLPRSPAAAPDLCLARSRRRSGDARSTRRSLPDDLAISTMASDQAPIRFRARESVQNLPEHPGGLTRRTARMTTRRSSPTFHPPTSGLVDIVSGSFGAGHDAAACAIADRLRVAGIRTRTWDVVDLLPGRLGRVLRSGYLRQLRSAPGSWRSLLQAVEHHDLLTATIRAALRTAEGGLLDIAAGRPDAFVSTHPFASQALGHLRSIGRLDARVTTYLTDMSVHRLWVHPGVDEHLAIHDLPHREAVALGARSVSTVRPAVRAMFTSVRADRWSRDLARQVHGLPRGKRLALLTGGSCGIGKLLESALDVAATGVMSPVVLCGTNTRLMARIRRHPELLGLGWVDDMPQLLTAVDAVVQNAGGITCLEAAAAGVPMITYRCIPGHGETNAAALEAAGTAPWVRRRGELAAALTASLHRTRAEDSLGYGTPDVLGALFPVLPAPELTA